MEPFWRGCTPPNRIDGNRKRSVAGAYDAGEGTMVELAERFTVSYWWVKKILRLRRETGSVTPVSHRGGRRPTIDGADIERLKHLLEDSPDMTLAQIREALGMSCSTVAVHYTLKRPRYPDRLHTRHFCRPHLCRSL